MNTFRRYMVSSLRRAANLYQRRFMSIEAQSKSSKGQHLLLIIPIASFGLGTWQVRRLEWKKGLIKEMEAKTQKEAVPLPHDILTPTRMEEMQYRRVIVHGKFDHSKEIYVGPRSLNADKESKGGLVSGKPTSGYHVVTPFVLDSGERILVNRGWVPKGKKKPDTRTEGQVIDAMQLTGFVRKGEKRPPFAPKSREDGFDWHYCDVENFSKLLNTTPLLIDADSVSTSPGGPLGGQTRVSIRNEHMQYIITWYSLSAATFFLYYQMRRKPGAMFRAGPTARE
ncbi:surfeit locus protein 1-like [Hydractinia symbiolongicarpus]|uniref:surfeit locus protein 1-like n=1 Tax=Hydractinia symbiolongicarpus TaxID=13093 RepID=UPI002549D16C|nr:surfeit locus protein 1-like [Hydractinia symbiolongicarpus]XP_057309252.1 surfeit locus protein 1-like [Hydractinia symbiolongicarpus]